MGALRTVPQSLAGLLRCLWRLASYAFLFVSAFVAPRAQAAATIVALSSQLAACKRRVEQKEEPRPRLSRLSGCSGRYSLAIWRGGRTSPN